jgi:ABC-2 type transport system ATP-binding protein
MSAATPALELLNVRKSYGKVEALHDVTLSVKPGEMVGLVGPNGAGKSTLFQIAAGLFDPDAGEVRLFGFNYRKHASAILARLGVVFQSRSLDLDMTVRDNLAFHGNLFGLSGVVLRNRMDEATVLLGIGDVLSRRARSLSGGNQRRVEVARALLNQPDMLLLDEPTAGLDWPTRQALVEHVRTISRDRGTAVIWATHLVDEIELADRVISLGKGAIVGNQLTSQAHDCLSARLSGDRQIG